jgi:hypothetical protein
VCVSLLRTERWGGGIQAICLPVPALPTPLNFQDNLECQVFQALQVQWDPQVPRVSVAALALLD